ncbi:MAG TPA: hypothetical protein VFQ35_24455 [Polyangiaceae bacterium]|nr:hypothetical protein [Polyangiaceae bacterium]
MTWLRKFTGALGLVTLGALCVPGCADNNSMLFIEGVLAVEASDCIAKAESGALIREGGTLDLSLRSGYRAALLVGSQLTQRGSREQLRTETARLVLKGADITLQDAYGRNLDLGGNPNPFSTIGTGFVNPAAGTEPGLGVIFVDVIPSVLSDAVSGALNGSGLVLAKIKAFGETLGNQKVESGEFLYPIQICRGCLISYPATSMTGAVGALTCAAPTQGSSTETLCSLGQDQFVPCTQCLGIPACSDPCQNCTYRAGSPQCTGAAPDECAQ